MVYDIFSERRAVYEAPPVGSFLNVGRTREDESTIGRIWRPERDCAEENRYALSVSSTYLHRFLSACSTPHTLPDSTNEGASYGDTFAVAVTSVFVAAAQAFGIFRLHPKCRIHGPMFVSGHKG